METSPGEGNAAGAAGAATGGRPRGLSGADLGDLPGIEELPTGDGMYMDVLLGDLSAGRPRGNSTFSVGSGSDVAPMSRSRGDSFTAAAAAIAGVVPPHVTAVAAAAAAAAGVVDGSLPASEPPPSFADHTLAHLRRVSHELSHELLHVHGGGTAAYGAGPGAPPPPGAWELNLAAEAGAPPGFGQALGGVDAHAAAAAAAAATAAALRVQQALPIDVAQGQPQAQQALVDDGGAAPGGFGFDAGASDPPQKRRRGRPPTGRTERDPVKRRIQNREASQRHRFKQQQQRADQAALQEQIDLMTSQVNDLQLRLAAAEAKAEPMAASGEAFTRRRGSTTRLNSQITLMRDEQEKNRKKWMKELNSTMLALDKLRSQAKQASLSVVRKGHLRGEMVHHEARVSVLVESALAAEGHHAVALAELYARSTELSPPPIGEQAKEFADGVARLFEELAEGELANAAEIPASERVKGLSWFVPEGLLVKFLQLEVAHDDVPVATTSGEDPEQELKVKRLRLEAIERAGEKLLRPFMERLVNGHAPLGCSQKDKRNQAHRPWAFIEEEESFKTVFDQEYKRSLERDAAARGPVDKATAGGVRGLMRGFMKVTLGGGALQMLTRFNDKVPEGERDEEISQKSVTTSSRWLPRKSVFNAFLGMGSKKRSLDGPDGAMVRAMLTGIARMSVRPGVTRTGKLDALANGMATRDTAYCAEAVAGTAMRLIWNELNGLERGRLLLLTWKTLGTETLQHLLLHAGLSAGESAVYQSTHIHLWYKEADIGADHEDDDDRDPANETTWAPWRRLSKQQELADNCDSPIKLRDKPRSPTL